MYRVVGGVMLIMLIMLVGCGGVETASAPVFNVEIMTQPNSVVMYATQSTTLSVTARGTGAHYQWQRNGVDIPGATLPSYALFATNADNGASYTVTVTGASGMVVSSPAILTVKSATPFVITTPTDQSVVAGQNATFTVTADGLPSLSYQWLKNGAEITGATATSYTTPVTLADSSSQYSVKISNSMGTITSSAATLTVQASGLSHLVISEVASCYYYNDDCWFEIYNPTTAAIDLSGYTVYATSVDVTTGATSLQSFTLPNVMLPSDGYTLISGNNNNEAQRNNQIVRVRSGNLVPYWGANGFIELKAAGSTVDFVRFGTSAQTPATAGAWLGSSVAALPSSPSDFGKAIVRLYPRTVDTDNDTAGDWTQVAWVTPAGRNDVPANAVDADNDGIPDSAEVSGGTYAGLDLYAMGARTAKRDIFIEIDHMTSSDPGVIPRSESLQSVVEAFAAQSIAMHFDAGTEFSGSFSVASFNLGQGSNVVPYEPCVTLDQVTCSANTSNRRSIYDWKEDNMDMRRRAIFHYLLMGNSQKVDGTAGSSGVAELPGNDFIVSMGNWGFVTTNTSILNQLINMQASTIMHELGHNLGLRHGGFENTNFKPNYWSVMNYTYQLSGLDGNPAGSYAYLRWRKASKDGTPSLCSLPNSPCGTRFQFFMDYSDGSSSDLNEASLLEANNIGRGSTAGAYADWDVSGTKTASVLARDLNCNGTTCDGLYAVLKDYNDWANLTLPFVRLATASNGATRSATSSITVVPNPVTHDRQPVADETAPPTSFFDELRSSQ